MPLAPPPARLRARCTFVDDEAVDGDGDGASADEDKLDVPTAEDFAFINDEVDSDGEPVED